MRDRSTALNYKAEDLPDVFSGAQTNIPASKYLIKKLGTEKLKKILMICSDEVINDNVVVLREDGSEYTSTTYGYYTSEISRYMRENGYSDDETRNAFIQIELKNINPGNKNQMEIITKKIKDYISDAPDNRDLYIDFTGGTRSAAMLLVFFARFFEKNGVGVKKVLYSNIVNKDSSGISKIEDYMDTYSLFDWLDAIKDITKHDASKARVMAAREGRTALKDKADITESTNIKITAQQYGDITEEEKGDFHISDDADIIEEATVTAMNKAKIKLTPESIIQHFVDERDASGAVRYITENILSVLIEKGIVEWKSPGYPKEKKDWKKPFLAYARYYRSYLRFVEEMLQFAKNNNTGSISDQCKLYINEKSVLTKSERVSFSLSSFLEREFDWKNHDIISILEKELYNEIKNNDEISINSVLNAVNTYKSNKNRYMNTYFSNGFPFANEYGKQTYSKFGYKWIPDEYKKRLNRVVDNLSKMSTEECENILEKTLSDRNALAEYFSPVCIETMFVLKRCNFRQFADKAILIDEIRGLRNGLVHNKFQTMQEIEKALRLSGCFSEWLMNPENYIWRIEDDTCNL